MKIANIIGKIMMVILAFGSFNWTMTILGINHEIFFPGDIPSALLTYALFIASIIITISTGRQLKKRKNAGKK